MLSRFSYYIRGGVVFLYRWKGFIKSLHLSRDPQKNRKSRSALKMHWAPCHYLSIGIQVPSQNVIGPDNGAFITSLPAHRTVCGSIGYMKKTSPPHRYVDPPRATICIWGSPSVRASGRILIEARSSWWIFTSKAWRSEQSHSFSPCQSRARHRSGP